MKKSLIHFLVIMGVLLGGCASPSAQQESVNIYAGKILSLQEAASGKMLSVRILVETKEEIEVTFRPDMLPVGGLRPEDEVVFRVKNNQLTHIELL
ncbi:MAG: hypothetical protein IBX45_10935 [Campylobacterales bacterium]|nr:hypothetical protein [Campylobacterales bacterium]